MEKSEVIEDLKTFKSLDALKDSEGGKILLEGVVRTVRDKINELTIIYTKASHIELISVISDISAQLGIYSKLNNAKGNKKMTTEELDKILSNETN